MIVNKYLDIIYQQINKLSVKAGYIALMIHRKKIISIGYNRYKIFHFDKNKYETNKYTWHAEQICIMNCKNKHLIKKSTMILIRWGQTDHVKPCNMCIDLINKYKIGRLYCCVLKNIS